MSEADPAEEQGAHAREPIHRPTLAAVLAAGVAAVLTVALVGLPREGAPLPSIARYATEIALPRWHTTEPVNELVYGTRGLDTFGETFFLLAAVVSVMTLTRGREPRRSFSGEERAGEREQAAVDPQEGVDAQEREARRAEYEEEPGGGEDEPATPDAIGLGVPAPERSEAMSVVVRTAARTAAPVLAVAAGYLLAWGYTPGGGFPGGAVILGVVLLLYAGFGRRRVAVAIDRSLLETVELARALAIAGLGVAVFGGEILAHYMGGWVPVGGRALGIAFAADPFGLAYGRGGEPGAMRLLRAVHTGSVNDYAAFSAAGFVCAVALLVL